MGIVLSMIDILIDVVLFFRSSISQYLSFSLFVFFFASDQIVHQNLRPEIKNKKSMNHWWKIRQKFVILLFRHWNFKGYSRVKDRNGTESENLKWKIWQKFFIHFLVRNLIFIPFILVILSKFEIAIHDSILLKFSIINNLRFSLEGDAPDFFSLCNSVLGCSIDAISCITATAERWGQLWK